MQEKNAAVIANPARSGGRGNSVKHMVPCFIEDILQEISSVDRHVTQVSVQRELEFRYGVKISRNALTRQINTMLLLPEVFRIFSARDGLFHDADHFRCGRFLAE